MVFTFSIISAFVGYLLRIFVARTMTPYEYGLFYGSFVLLTFIGLFNNLGLNDAIAKFTSEFRVKNKYREIKSIIVYSILIKFLIFSFICAIVILFSNKIATVFIGDPTAGEVLRTLVFTVLLTALIPVFQSVLRGLHKVKYYSFVSFMSIFSVFLFALFLLPHSPHKPVTFAYSYLLGGVMTGLISLLFFLRSFDFFSVDTVFSKTLLKKLLSYSIPSFAYSIAFVIISYTDTIMISMMKGAELVGNYQVAMPSARIILYFAMSLSTVLLPVFSEMWAKNEKKEIRNLLSKLVKLSFVIVLPISLVFVSFPRIVINIFFGSKYIWASDPLRILAIGYLFYTLSTIYFNLMNGMGKPKLTAKVIYICAITNVVLNALLIPKFGLVGAASASAFSLILSSVLSHKILKKEFMSHGIEIVSPKIYILKTLGAGILTTILIYILKAVINLNPWLELFSVLVPSLLFYSFLVLRLHIVTYDDLKFLKEINLPIPKFLIRVVRIIAGW